MAAPIKDEDKPWSEMDLFDLENGLTRGDTIAELADFLMRREDEVERKAIELGLLSPSQNAQLSSKL